MKKTIVQTFMATLFLAGLTAFGSVQAQYYDDSCCFEAPCADPCFECVTPCEVPCNPGGYSDCGWEWDECCWEPCSDSPSRVYVGPVYYFRRSDYGYDDSTEFNAFGTNSKSKLRGQFVGINFGYEYREICSFYARADATWSTGTERPCPRHRLNDWQTEGRVGYTWGECIPQGYGVTPYVGIGYLWQGRKFNSIPLSLDYSSWYVPIGLYADVEVIYGFTAGIDFAFAPFFSSEIDVNHREYDLDKHGSRSRYLWRVTLPLRWQVMVDSGFEISVEPFWEQIHFGRVSSSFDQATGILTGAGIPELREDFWGAKFLVAFKF